MVSLLCCMGLSAQVPVVVRQHWDAATTAETLRRDFKQWRQKGVTGVCFDAGTDCQRIQMAARAAHEAGLSYQAWVPTLTQKGLPKAWYTVNRMGQSALDYPAYDADYTTLDPKNREVHRYLAQQMTQIAAIREVDGVTLGFVRYADAVLPDGLATHYGLTMNGEFAPADYCYCADCTRIFQDATGMDILSVADPAKIDAWAQFRCDALTDLMNELCTAIHAQGKQVGADVYPNIDDNARRMVRQEWSGWQVDAVFPMNYPDYFGQPSTWVGRATREEVRAVEGREVAVYSSLTASDQWESQTTQFDLGRAGLSPSALHDAIVSSVANGATGLRLDTPGNMTEAHWNAFAQAMQEVRTMTSSKPLSRAEAAQAKDDVCRDFLASVGQETQKILNEHAVEVGDRTMRLHWSTFGEPPADGRSLWISLHGGGGVAYREDNIQQWTNQWRLYQPKEGIYLCPLSPVDAWNMWCQADADAFYHKIILMAVAQLGVNPDKVYILGYSAGGDGVWRMGPRMADCWAAASMMAGHPGDVRLENLRNTPFMVWCGANDAAYQRNTLDAERLLELDSLQRNDPEGYVHGGQIVPGMGHWMMRADTAAIPWMAQYRRNPYPKTIVWQQEEVLRPSFYWVSAPQKELQRYKQVRLHVEGNTIFLDRCDYSHVTLWLNDELVDLNKSVKVVYNGRTLFSGKLPRTRLNLLRSMADREDTSYAFPACVDVKVE